MDNFNTIYWLDTLSKIRMFLVILVFASGCFLLLVLFVVAAAGPSDRLTNLTTISSVSFLYSVWGTIMIPSDEVLIKIFESGNSMVVKQLLLDIHNGMFVLTYILLAIYDYKYDQ